MREEIRQRALKEGKGVIKFLIVGGVSFLIYSGMYFALTRWWLPMANLTLMNILSICTSGLFNFAAHRGWTYRATHASSRTQIGRYLAVVVSAAVLQSFLFWLSVEHIGILDLYVLIPIAGICAFYTYFAHRLFTFRKAQNPVNVL
ncbi:GtrA family protein [Candidatus Uhrbacteria bacterium]|nr:GtrA family protein [Candidatus Uhrbacteria bacterium]